MIVVADTSGIIASVDRSSADHTGARRVMDTAGLVVIPPPVLAELDHLVGSRWGKEASGTLLDRLLGEVRRGRYALADAGLEVLQEARRVQRRYRELRLDLCDAVVVALAREYATDMILTLDRKDFRTLRPLSGPLAFRLLPDDL
ncbi:type II toxin-antitoxin system VapC family toxin [Streptomyces aidingensis]|uniref:Ribonuclease VapC n=1 Tax=Streptomyces aidingensis TaxID=910347 RepID=A0A1I1Q2Y2_9ACTN|nr:PIN domain-containing protein [Streptomyces aidingensis]SFD16504.1 Predicted nucleic acid-binding protein, contains PIN domain [Streptomyces aidingensis]